MKNKKTYKDYLDQEISFGISSYYTLYKYRANNFCQKVCFADMISKISNDLKKEISFSIKICLTDECYRRNYSHFCLVSKKDIKRYMDMLVRLLSFTYTLEYVDDDCIITITIQQGKHKRNHALLIATCIRYLYEFPYNIILFDALKLHKEKEFQRTHILNCILTVGSVCGVGLGYGHGLGYASTWSSISVITPRGVIKKNVGIKSCNDIFNIKERNLIGFRKQEFYYFRSNKIHMGTFIQEYNNRLVYYKEFKDKCK